MIITQTSNHIELKTTLDVNTNQQTLQLYENATHNFISTMMLKNQKLHSFCTNISEASRNIHDGMRN